MSYNVVAGVHNDAMHLLHYNAAHNQIHITCMSCEFLVNLHVELILVNSGYAMNSQRNLNQCRVRTSMRLQYEVVV